MLTAIVPSKNHGMYLENLIANAILSDKSPVSRLLICNDASTDNTAAVLAKFAGDPRVRVFENAVSMGAMESQNMMFSHVDTPYVMFVASDDVFFPDKMAKLFSEMIESDSYVGFGKYMVLEGEHATEISHPGWLARGTGQVDEFCTLLSCDHYIFSCTSIFKREFLPRHGPENAPYNMSLTEQVVPDGLGMFRGQDWNMVLEIARDHPDRFYFLNEYCGYFRKLEGQYSAPETYNDTGRAAFEMAILIIKHLSHYAVRKRVKNSAICRAGVQNLFYAKCGQITEAAKRSHNFQEIYKPILLTAETLINNM
jgi:glycosyltransferase involved in cell wall biosynthesis